MPESEPASEGASNASGRERLAIAGAAFAGATPLAYAAQRLFEVARGGGASTPDLVIYTNHVGYYWRVLAATWWGLVAAILVYALGARASERALTLGVAASGLFAAALAWIFP